MFNNLSQLLHGCISSDSDVRLNAEQQIFTLRRQAGFGPALLHELQQQSLQQDLRQLAGILLKQYINEQWCLEEVRNDGLPQITEQEKIAIRQSFPQLLAEPCSKLRTNVALGIASIAKWDYPEVWPELMPVLLEGIKQRQNVHIVHGCIQCLNELCTELAENQLVPVFQEMEQELFSILKEGDGQNMAFKEVIVPCLSIFRTWLESLRMMQGVYQEQVQQSISNVLPKWLQIICQKMMEMPQDGHNWNQQIECLQIIQSSIRGFSHVISAALPQIVELCVNLTGLVAQTLSQDEDAVLDVTVQGLETLITISDNSQRSSLLVPYLPHIIKTCLYATSSPDEDSLQTLHFIETDVCEQSNLRSSAALLLANLFNNSPNEFDPAFQQQILQLMQQNLSWEKYEAAMFLVGYIYMQEQLNKQQYNLIQMMCSVFQDNNNNSNAPKEQIHPFVLSRALWICSCLFSNLPTNLQDLSVHAAIKFLGKTDKITENLAACKLLTVILSEKQNECENLDFSPILKNLIYLLQQPLEECTALILKCVELIIRTNSNSVSQLGPNLILQPTIQLWENKIGDVVLMDSISNVISAFLNSKILEQSVQQQMLPILCNSVVHNQDQNRQENAMNLLISVVRNSSVETCKFVFDHLNQILFVQNFIEDASGEFCNSIIALLSHLIGKIGSEILNVQNIHQQLINIVVYLLRQDVPEEKCVGVGKLIYLMLKYMQENTMNFAEILVQNVVLKLGQIQQSNILLKEELFIIVCKMLQVDFAATLKIISNISNQATNFIFESLTTLVQESISKFHQNIFATTLTQILMVDRQITDQIQIKVNFENFKYNNNNDNNENNNLAPQGIQTRAQRAKNQQQQIFEIVPLSVAATISLIRVFSSLSEDIEEDWDDSCDDENDKENINALNVDSVFDKNNVGNNYYNNNGDEKILDVTAFDPKIEQDPFYSMNLVSYMSEFFSKCVQQQNEPFKFAMSKCSVEEQRLVFGIQQNEQ